MTVNENATASTSGSELPIPPLSTTAFTSKKRPHPKYQRQKQKIVCQECRRSDDLLVAVGRPRDFYGGRVYVRVGKVFRVISSGLKRSSANISACRVNNEAISTAIRS